MAVSPRIDPTKEFEQYIWNHQMDDSVSPPALVIAIKGQNPTGGYTAVAVDASGHISVVSA